MIVYELNKHFLQDIRHLTRSWTMVKILRSVLAIGLYSALVTAGIHYSYLNAYQGLNSSIFSFLGYEKIF